MLATNEGSILVYPVTPHPSGGIMNVLTKTRKLQEAAS